MEGNPSSEDSNKRRLYIYAQQVDDKELRVHDPIQSLSFSALLSLSTAEVKCESPPG